MKMNLSLKSLLPPIDFGWNRTRAVCGLTSCHNKLLMRAVPQSRTGIQMGQLWYCSVDCFATAARSPLLALSMGRVTEMPRNPRLSLGLALLSKGFLTEEQLRFAVDQSQWHGEELEATLARFGLAGEKQLAGARAAQWGYPVLGLELGNHLVPTDIPRSLLEAFSAAPLHYAPSAKRLVLGFVDRVEHSLLQALEQVTGCRAEPCFITPTEFQEQMRRVTAAEDYEEVVVDDPGTPAQMAKSLGGYALEVTAREAAFVQCKNHIWTRLSGKRRVIDVVFRLKNVAAPVKNTNSALLEESVGSLG